MRPAPLLLPALLASTSALAGGDHAPASDQTTAIRSGVSATAAPAFDIRAAHAHRTERSVTFHASVEGEAGAVTPAPIGALGGAAVYSYVWPVSLDPSSVGFDEGAGILALAVTSHPDFDDTPLYDENGDGDLANDGGDWHSHWVVLSPNEACGPDALSVVDIPEGAAPDLPATWPGLPLLIDSPGFTPLFDGGEVLVTAGFRSGVALEGVGYDGVTAALAVNASVHAPLLCVTDVFDIASGDLNLPGRID